MLDTKKKLELIGWILFSLGSLVFFIDNIRLSNYIGAIGSLVFLIGCGFFMISEKF